jgi:glycosyltransferase involved in cell wall biosynthesis
MNTRDAVMHREGRGAGDSGHTARPMPHICMLALATYPILAGDRSIRVVGGAEVQQAFLARAFRREGYRVSLLSYDYGQPDSCEIDGIEIRKVLGKPCNIPVLRYVHPKLTSVWSGMEGVNADIYYQRCAAAYTGVAAAFARAKRRRFVYAAAHDLDFMPGKANSVGRWRDRQIFTFGLRHADKVVVQNPVQAARLQRWTGQSGILIPSCYSLPRHSGGRERSVVLWVGVMRAWKRPEVFLDLAESLPHLNFRMIGGPCLSGSADDFYERIAERAARLSNVDFLGFVPYADVERHFDEARVFVNTSDAEGFPNTFLQAWARGIPSVSFIDCGAKDAHGAVGLSVPDIETMAGRIDLLMKDTGQWEHRSARCRAHFEASHSMEAVGAAYRRTFDSLLSDVHAGTGS